MKNVIRMFFLTVVLLVPVVISAQGSESTAPEPRSLKEGTLDDNNFVITSSTSGSIVGISEGILTVKNQKGKEFRIALGNKTVFRLGKKKIDPSELDETLFSAGKPVKVTYLPFNDRQKRADKIAVEVRFDDDKNKAKPVLGDS